MNTCEYLLRMIVPWSNLRQNWEIQHYTIQGVPLCTIQIDCNVCFKCLKVIQRNKDFEIRALSIEWGFHLLYSITCVCNHQHAAWGWWDCRLHISLQHQQSAAVLQWGALLVPQLGRREEGLRWPSANVFISPASARPGCKPINLYSFSAAAVWVELSSEEGIRVTFSKTHRVTAKVVSKILW